MGVGISGPGEVARGVIIPDLVGIGRITSIDGRLGGSSGAVAEVDLEALRDADEVQVSELCCLVNVGLSLFDSAFSANSKKMLRGSNGAGRKDSVEIFGRGDRTRGEGGGGGGFVDEDRLGPAVSTRTLNLIIDSGLRSRTPGRSVVGRGSGDSFCSVRRGLRLSGTGLKPLTGSDGEDWTGLPKGSDSSESFVIVLFNV